MDAYEAFLRGRFHLLQHSDGIRQALPFLQEAVALDASYAEAHAALAHAHLMLALFGGVPGHAVFPQVRAHGMLASVAFWYDWDVRAALAHAERAVALAPGTPLPHTLLGFLLTTLGGHDEALAASARAVALDPLSASYRTDRVVLLVLARRYEEAVAEAEALLAFALGASLATRWQGAALDYLGRTGEATAALERAVASSGRHPLMLNALAQHRRAHGDRSGALAVQRELQERAAHEHVAPLALLTGMEDGDGVWEAALAARDFWLVMLHVNPAYEQDAAGDPHRQARLARFIERVGVARQR